MLLIILHTVMVLAGNNRHWSPVQRPQTDVCVCVCVCACVRMFVLEKAQSVQQKADRQETEHKATDKRFAASKYDTVCKSDIPSENL